MLFGNRSSDTRSGLSHEEFVVLLASCLKGNIDDKAEILTALASDAESSPSTKQLSCVCIIKIQSCINSCRPFLFIILCFSSVGIK